MSLISNSILVLVKYGPLLKQIRKLNTKLTVLFLLIFFFLTNHMSLSNFGHLTQPLKSTVYHSGGANNRSHTSTKQLTTESIAL